MGCVSSKDPGQLPGASSAQRTAAATFSSQWKRGKKLGVGAYAVVYQCTNKRTGEKAAVKVVDRARLTETREAALKQEVALMKKLDHPHVVKLIEFYEEEKNFFVVIELCEGGELFERIVEKTIYTEKEARELCRILFSALAYCHAENIVHRDIKPQNLLMVSPSCDSRCKIADFGFAAVVPDGSKLSAKCGSPYFIAPEILMGKPYGPQPDVWSAGVILYILLGGTYPFAHENRDVLFDLIKSGTYNFDLDTFRDVSDDAKDLIKKLLVVDPAKRLTAEQVLKHHWITESDAVLEAHDLANTKEELKRFNARRKWRAAGSAVILTHRLSSLTSQKSETNGTSIEDEVGDELKLDEWAEAHTEARTNFQW